MSGDPLDRELIERLEEVSARSLAEHLAARLGLLEGERRVELTFSEGSLHRAYIHAGPLRWHELERRPGV